jgi:multidrug efflux pump subunit AcrA (membrane-fusion protein)
MSVRTLPLSTTRRGISWSGLSILVLLAAGITGAAWLGRSSFVSASAEIAPITYEVGKAVFSHVVTEDGEIESSSNIEVRCEVQSRNTAGTAILWLAPEGSIVKKEELIARLDSSALESELNLEEKTCKASEATVITANATFETAKIAKDEYLNGTFKELEQTLLGEIAVAQENLRRSEDYLIYSEKLAAKDYVTQLQLEADRFAVEKAKNDMGIAQTKLEVLRVYTRAKTLATLEADIKTAEANLASEEAGHKLNLDKRDLIAAQIKKCEIYAPASGQIVYANQQSDRRGSQSDIMIQEGAMVRERQVIFRIPDPKKMQVKANISESRIDRVRPRMPAVVRVDALPEAKLVGVVRRVDDYPVQGNWFSNVKEYSTYIEIQGEAAGLRPGMTAEVQIQVANIPDVIQVPVQAIVEHGGKHFCLVKNGPSLSPHEISIGTTNDKFVVVRDGLSEKDVVLVDPRKYLDQVTLPDVPPSEPIQIAQVDLEEEPTSPAVGSLGTNSDTAQAEAPAEEKPKKKPTLPGAGGQMDPQAIVGFMMQQYDKDSDGKLSQDEMPEQGRERFPQTDANKDGFVDRQELVSAINARMKQAMNGGGMGPGGPGGPGGGN